MGRLWFVALVILAAGCTSGAVVFAPTPLPPDLSPLRYEHPSGAFSLAAPRYWAVHVQNTTTLASASFSTPGALEAELTIAVVKLDNPMDTAAFADALNRYQTQIRPDAARYKEESRQAMGDGSWRMTGLRAAPGGATQQVNTFFEQAVGLVAVTEVIVPDDPALVNELQTAVNTLSLNPDAPLETANLSTLVAVSSAALEVNHLYSWTTPTGVFFVTGEVANLGSSLVTNLPVRAVLYTADGLPVAEAVDAVMGYGIEPGEYAPFSLRFGQGQPALTTSFEISLGGATWQPQPDITIYGAGELSWIDESTFDQAGRLVITGAVTNTGSQVAQRLRAVVTVFDQNQNVIAAGFTDLEPEQLAPDETTHFQIIVPEMGGEPTQYILNIQAVP